MKDTLTQLLESPSSHTAVGLRLFFLEDWEAALPTLAHEIIMLADAVAAALKNTPWHECLDDAAALANLPQEVNVSYRIGHYQLDDTHLTVGFCEPEASIVFWLEKERVVNNG